MAGLLGGATPSSASLRDQPELFFQPGPEAPKDLSATRLYPQGKRFPFALPLPVEGKQKAECERLGVVLFDATKTGPVDPEEGLFTATGVGLVRASEEMVFTDPDEVTRQVAAQVTAAAENPKIAFWNLLPGAIRFREKREMAYLKAASRAIEHNDPLKRPIWTWLPPEANTAYLAHIAPWVGYLGKALQPPVTAQERSRIWFRWAVERAVEAIHEVDAEATPVAVPVAPDASSHDDAGRIATQVRHDLYLSLITGARGVIAIAPAQPAGLPEQEAFRNACLRVASELSGTEKLGEAFLFGERREQIEVDVVEGPAEVELFYPEGGVRKPLAYHSVSFVDLACGKERFLVLVNSAMEPVTLMIGGMPYAAVRAETLFESHPAMDVAEGEFEAELQPLEVRIYRMTRR